MQLVSRLLATGLLAAAVPLVAACDWMKPKEDPQQARVDARKRAVAERLKAACSSQATYDRLKQVAFDEAIHIRNADPVNLDTLATHSVVRMEEPRVISRDEELDVTVCKGRFILEMPPGAERAFAGERRLVADIEYAAQAAADGTGLVYQIKGAEPIIYKLAAFDLRNGGRTVAAAAPATPTVVAERMPLPQEPQATFAPPRAPEPVATRVAKAPPRAPTPAREPPRAAPEPEREPVRTAQANPSFNCRHARSRSERMVCGNGGLAALDRAMSSQYYSALSNASAASRADLRRSRNRFLAYRDRCPDEGCVAQAYRDRMAEIRDIAAAGR